MISLRAVSIAFLTVTALIPGCRPEDVRTDGGDDREAIRALVSRTEAMNNSRDAIGWASLFTPDAVYMPPGLEAITSHQELVAIAETAFRTNSVSISIEPQEIEIFGDWAFARSRVTGMVAPRAGGDGSVIDMKQLVLYRKTEDGWRIARLVNNSNR